MKTHTTGNVISLPVKSIVPSHAGRVQLVDCVTPFIKLKERPQGSVCFLLGYSTYVAFDAEPGGPNEIQAWVTKVSVRISFPKFKRYTAWLPKADFIQMFDLQMLPGDGEREIGSSGLRVRAATKAEIDGTPEDPFSEERWTYTPDMPFLEHVHPLAEGLSMEPPPFRIFKTHIRHESTHPELFRHRYRKARSGSLR